MKKRTLFTAATLAAVVTTSITPTAQAVSFSDIKNNPNEQAILSLAAQNIISGYKDGTFQPTRQLSRSDVVKILGKYLVSIGHKVPSDYKTTMRFTDLTKNSSDELLRYAAVVKDAGVFIGSSGRLLPDQFMKREHMALVLVRAFSQIENFNYVDYVKRQTFLEDFLDEDFLTEENADAIRVFDYFEVVVDDYFKPKAAATRGDFAGAMYKMLSLQEIKENEPFVENIDVVSSDRITVTMTNGTKHNIRLDNPLAENKPTEINIHLYNKVFKETVTYRVNALQIKDVYNVNGSQFVIEFNQPVDLADTYNEQDLQKLFSLRMNMYSNTVRLVSAEASTDKRSLTVTAQNYSPFSAEYYRLQLVGSLHSQTGETLADYENIYRFKKDTSNPYVARAEYMAKGIVRLHFSEPLNSSYYSATFRTVTGETITGIATNATSNRYVEFNLNNAKINNKTVLADHTQIRAIFTNLYDVAGNVTKTAQFQFMKANPDGTKATVRAVEQLGAKQFKLTFSEPMSALSYYDLDISSGGRTLDIDTIEQVQYDVASFVVTMEDYLEGQTIIRTRPYQEIYDATGQATSFLVSKDFTYNVSEPNVSHTEVVRQDNNEYLYVYFDEEVKVASNAQLEISGSYQINDQRHVMTASQKARAYSVPNDTKAVRVLLKDLLLGIDREHTNYTVNAKLTNVTNGYNVPLKLTHTVSFTRSKDYYYNYNQLQVVSVETSRTNVSIKDSKMIAVNFNYNVDAATATDLYNYDLERYAITSATINPLDPKQVLLTFDADIYTPTQLDLYIDDVRAQDAITRMEPQAVDVYLNETIRPSLQSSLGYIDGDYTVLQPSIQTGSRELTLTFNEAIYALEGDSFVVSTATGQTLDVTTKVSATDSSKVVLTFAEPLRAGQKLLLSLKPNRAITDLYYNESLFRKGTVTLYTGVQY